ncbi:unnamed protein product [Caenorhabditis brenneri]
MYSFFISFLIFFPLVLAQKSAADKFYDSKNCEAECRFKGLITPQNISTFPTCSRVCTYLIFTEDTEVTEDQLTVALKNMKILIGGLMIFGAPFTHTKFLEPLEEIECDDVGISIVNNAELTVLGMINLKSIDCPGFRFSGNELLTGLSMPSLKNMSYNESVLIEISIVSALPKFCLDPNEARAFAGVRYPSYVQVYVPFCEPKYNEKLCKTPAEGCVELFGKIYIGSDFNIGLIRNIEVIYGNLIINGTSLSSFDDFENLQCIVSLEFTKTTLRIENNLNLVNPWFPKVQKIYSNGKEEIVFNKNAPELLLDPSLCFDYQLLSSEMKEDVPKFNGETCDEVEKKVAERNKTYVESRLSTTTMGSIITSVAPGEVTTQGIPDSPIVETSTQVGIGSSTMKDNISVEPYFLLLILVSVLILRFQ